MEDKPEPLLTSSQVAELVGVSRHTIANWVRAGKLVPTLTTMGGQHRFRWSDVARQLREARERDDG
ncbi:helix-turn-helix domain-containing protein [Pseudonocardia lacus]|uniref:helix-turn-helix domain-containing protein n=1 Tax=Pseudonocardia lacus TaxID=2835865 RepID=UPI001BDBC922|nr:helix-turn-helix domain-containing protein [Pseudonocardia lacus]